MNRLNIKDINILQELWILIKQNYKINKLHILFNVSKLLNASNIK